MGGFIFLFVWAADTVVTLVKGNGMLYSPSLYTIFKLQKIQEKLHIRIYSKYRGLNLLPLNRTCGLKELNFVSV
ncbi:hypothetical protein RJT34_28199 [Clitoria ternatea]|uniref:Uncharacterized protein n=1 Tax=Clitoria ternatea TaxID=43366 RepID=A0AAN9FAT4_CLITE